MLHTAFIIVIIALLGRGIYSLGPVIDELNYWRRIRRGARQIRRVKA